jgi:hypothetical protein
LYVGTLRRTVDRAIAYYSEFGPAFFRLANLVRISPAEYRGLSQYISTAGIQYKRRVIPLTPRNRARLDAAVRDLLVHNPREYGGEASRAPTVTQVLERLERATRAMETMTRPMDALDRMDLADLLRRLSHVAARYGL